MSLYSICTYFAMHEEADGQGDVEAALRLHFAGFHGETGGIGEVGV